MSQVRNAPPSEGKAFPSRVRTRFRARDGPLFRIALKRADPSRQRTVLSLNHWAKHKGGSPAGAKGRVAHRP
jgi:hypothetical protein